MDKLSNQQVIGLKTGWEGDCRTMAPEMRWLAQETIRSEEGKDTPDGRGRWESSDEGNVLWES